ncbi:metal-dependent hydrolase [Thermosulfurimonas sp. F29]|uniref:metal-dependent hydrolase n=1 Tax=Thermosulfurimonas sp. F29 TaxID=2867247 RepID=UPI001C836E5F|nr:metal-dependent hydrolase [Thermosulfurimonas sp. F29]MBX6424176.1 metal-dependent hydrolase [Thermosulfurimonas sp. F29]
MIYLITHSFPAAFIAALGSVFPDFVEFVFWGGYVPRYAHRKASHWPLPYLVLAALTFYYTANPFAFAMSWFSVGCLLHIAEDALTGKVPLLSPRRRSFGVRLFRTGSMPEMILAVILVALAIKTLFATHYRFTTMRLDALLHTTGLP